MGCIWAAGKFESRNLLKKKERETGIEPATSSLGIWTSIESKEQWRAMASTVEHQNRCSFHFPNSRAA
jgi:hypothetical protein